MTKIEVQQGTELVLENGSVTGPGDPKHAKVKRSSQGVRWYAKDKRNTLTFNQAASAPPPPDTNSWPFEPPPTNPIIVEQGTWSQWFKIRSNAKSAPVGYGYGYSIDPPPPSPAPKPVPELIPDPERLGQVARIVSSHPGRPHRGAPRA